MFSGSLQPAYVTPSQARFGCKKKQETQLPPLQQRHFQMVSLLFLRTIGSDGEQGHVDIVGEY